jgi:hypothetical protein
MARLRIDIDEETLQRLRELALRERRSTDAQGAVLLRIEVGLPFPPPPHRDEGSEWRRRCPLEN